MLIFHLIEKEGNVYRYRYTREDHEPDGIISIDSVTKEIRIEQQSIMDEDEIDTQNTIEMAYALIESNYPKKRTVMFY